MRKLLILFLFIPVFASGQYLGRYPFARAHTGSAAPTWTNLVSWWKMTETSGGVAYDSHGSDDATVESGTQTSNGIVFDGVNDWLSCDGYTHGTDNFTFIMILTPASTATSTTTLITGGTNSLQLRLEDNITPFLSKYGGTSSGHTDINLTLTTESMLAVVRNGDNYRFFIDGDFETEVFSGSQDFTAAWTFIGAYENAMFEYKGTMRDLCYFTEAKSDAFITWFYNSGSFRDYEDGESEEPTWTNLIGHWTLENGDLTDQHGSDDMSINGSAANSGDSCFHFGGSGDYLTFTGTTHTDQVTFLLKVWPESTGPYDLLGGTGTGELALYTYDVYLRPRVYASGGGSVPSLAMTEDEWNYLSVRVDMDHDSVRYGVDGVYEMENDFDNVGSSATNAVGSYSVGNDFNGYIKEIWIFSDYKTTDYVNAMENRDYVDGDPE